MAMTVETSRYFAGPVLSSDPRWNHGSIHVVGVNTETGTVDFRGNQSSLTVSVRIPIVLFGGRDVVESDALVWHESWHYNFNNPATGAVVPRMSFVKLLRVQGVPLLVGSDRAHESANRDRTFGETA